MFISRGPERAEVPRAAGGDVEGIRGFAKSRNALNEPFAAEHPGECELFLRCY